MKGHMVYKHGVTYFSIKQEQPEDPEMAELKRGIEKRGDEYACLKCDYKGNAKDSVNRHFRSQHMHQPVAVCEVCDKVYKNVQSLKVHRCSKLFKAKVSKA